MLRASLIGKALLVVAIVELATLPARADIDPGLRCRFGAYALTDGRTLVIDGYNSDAHDLEYVLSSGEYGHLAAISPTGYALRAGERDFGAATFSSCDTGQLTFTENGRPALSGHRIAMNVSETYFDSGATRLFGKLVMPADGKADAIVVMIQGSEDDPGTDSEFWQYELPLSRIGVFTYDKRGAGRSQGELSADFYVRASDTAAAVRKARDLAPGVIRFGVFGESQGGWVAPLTATQANIDFVVVGFGLAEGVTAQDRDEVEEMVRNAGYGDEVMGKVREITAATARVVKSEWQSGWSELAAVERKYQGEPWYKAIDGEDGYTAILLRTPQALARKMGPKLDKHVSFSYDPRPVIAGISSRQLWVLGGSDQTAPSSRTVTILKEIQAHKSSLDLVIFRNADHGIVETFTDNGVQRRRYSSGYFGLVAKWIKSDALPASDNNLAIWR